MCKYYIEYTDTYTEPNKIIRNDSIEYENDGSGGYRGFRMTYIVK